MVGIHVWLRVLSQLSPSIEVRLLSTVWSLLSLLLHHIQFITGLTGKPPAMRSLMIIDRLIVLHEVIGQ